MIWLFDIDGTLIRAGGAGSLAMSQALANEFDVPPETTGVSFSGRTDYAITQDLFRLHNISFTDSTVGAFYAAYLKLLPGALQKCDGIVLPGAVEWLEHLSEQADCSLGIITGNMKAAADIKLQHFGLAQHFRFGGYGDSSLNRDDVAAVAVAGAKTYLSLRNDGKNRLNASDVWVVGDTPFDISCARSQSLRVIGVATGGFTAEELRQHKPDLTLPNLENISVLFDLLAA